MTLVVADSSPIRYLAVLNVIGVLPQLYDRVILPRSVLNELCHPHAPAEARSWASALPAWAEVRQAARIELGDVLDAGEAEAIALAEELGADLVLIDEREARRVAVERGLKVAGIIGVLEQSAARHLIDLRQSLEKLLGTNFRIDRRYLEEALARDAMRQERERATPRRRDPEP